MPLSIVIPTLNEAPVIEATLTALQPLRRRGHEIILVDGGSDDGTPDKAVLLVDACLRAGPGRARQMNAGAARARHADLVFLHADTRLPAGADTAIEDALDRHGWGRFDVRIDSARRLLQQSLAVRPRVGGDGAQVALVEEMALVVELRHGRHVDSGQGAVLTMLCKRHVATAKKVTALSLTWTLIVSLIESITTF
jgi:glycosyltransferase involved in cell wall biosynthesis